MNRIVLIGNGFDLAHGLKTSYKDFINWYWDQRLHSIILEHQAVSADELCSMKIYPTSGYDNWYLFSCGNSYFKNPFKNEWIISGREFIEYLKGKPDFFNVTYSSLFKNICKNIETKGWVDIENEYYDLLIQCALEGKTKTTVESLNKQLCTLQEKLIVYLSMVNETEVKPKDKIKIAIYSPFVDTDISIEGQKELIEHIKGGLELSEQEWEYKLYQYGHKFDAYYIINYKKQIENGETIGGKDIPYELLLPNQIMLLNFNYTKTSDLYCVQQPIFSINQIHGKLDNPKSIIFGYGDEIDEKYKELERKRDNNCLSNIKSIKYLEADNYRKMLSFIEAEPYQIFIMGHSCGNSDRTLLNTLFEHRNCVSIKPYFYVKEDGTDNYLDIIQNISRNFTDMKLMRDRVVNKTYCETIR